MLRCAVVAPWRGSGAAGGASSATMPWPGAYCLGRPSGEGGGAVPARLDAEACAVLHCLLPHPPLPFVPQNGDIKEVMDKADKMAAEIAGKA